MNGIQPDFSLLNDKERALVDSARHFAAANVQPKAATWERERRVPVEVFQAAAEQGLWLPYQQPQAEDAPSALAMARVAEELAAGCLSVALPLMVQNYVSWAIHRYAVPAIQEELLPLMQGGEILGGFCLTEPEGGSDATALTTAAQQDEHGNWRLTGQKAWVLSGTVAEFFLVFAQVPKAENEQGIGLFVVPRNASGVRVGEPYDMVAGNALGCTFLVMQDVELPPDALLLGADDGLKFGLEVINHARLYIGAMACGLLRAGLEETINYTSFRELFGHAIINFQGVQWPLADTTTQLIAARQLVDKAAGTAPDAIHFRAAVAHAKKFASTVAYDGLSSCQRLMGANGLLATYDVGRHLHSSIMTYYLDGTSEIQNIMIARSLAS